MPQITPLGPSTITLTLATGESAWVVDDCLIGGDLGIDILQKMPLPSSTKIGQFETANLFLHKNICGNPATLILGGPLNSDIALISEHDSDIAVRAASFVAVNNGSNSQSYTPLFDDHPDYETVDWARFSGHHFIVISARGAIFRVPADGEYLVDVDTLVAFSTTLRVSPIAADGSSTAKRLAGIRQPIYRFSGRGSLWCQAGKPGEYATHLRPHLKTRERDDQLDR